MKPHNLTVLDGGYSQIIESKESLVRSTAAQAKSWRDFGGCYLVHGRYLAAAVESGATFASMVDVNPTPEFRARLASWTEAPEIAARIEGELIHGDFRSLDLYRGMRSVDASILYEVLLHQENYVEVMRQVALRTQKNILIAQPCLREKFQLPAAAVMLQFYDESTKAQLRQGSWWPSEGTPELFDTGKWMWGHTTSHLIAVMYGLGWRLHEGTLLRNACGPWWEFPIMSFEPRSDVIQRNAAASA